MKTILSIESDTTEKLELLIRIAEEMGMTVETFSKEVEPYTLVSEEALAEDWNSPADDRWDEVFAHLEK